MNGGYPQDFITLLVDKWSIMGSSGGKWELVKKVLIILFNSRLQQYAYRKVHSRPRSKKTTNATFKVAYRSRKESGCYKWFR